jgi:pyridoxine 4-dehydrogenase
LPVQHGLCLRARGPALSEGTSIITSTTASAGTWNLGDLTVNRIGFGAMRLTGGVAFDFRVASDRDRAIGLLRRVIELGVNHIDTAAFYPAYALVQDAAHDFTWLNCANELIRLALAPYPDDLVIVTKVGPTADGLARPDELRGLDSVAEHFGVLADLRQAGLIRHLGISNVRPAHLAQAREIAPVVCVQNTYGVDFGRVNDETLRACGDQGIAFVPFYAITAAGRAAGGVAENEAVLAVARAHGASPAQVRIAWTLHQGNHVLAIPGTGSPEHLAENIAAGTLRLSADELASLEGGPVT